MRLLIENIFKNFFLRWLFIFSFVASIFVVIFLKSYIIPPYYDYMMKNIVNDAKHVGKYLFYEYDVDANGILGIKNKSDRILNDLEIERIKFFDTNGYVLYSTKDSEIGSQNKSDAFKNQVAKGIVYHKTVTKGQITTDGRTVKRDVAEIYIPIIESGKFIGAFEIYYDITIKKNELNVITTNTIILGSIFTFIAFLAMCLIILYASKRDILIKESKRMVDALNFSLEEKVKNQTQEIRFTKEISIEAIASLAEGFDDGTGRHIKRVKQCTNLLAHWLHDEKNLVEANKVDDMALASTLHDIGKLTVPTDIINKPGKLNEKEWKCIREHSKIGGEVLARADSIFFDEFGKASYLGMAGEIAWYHHEKYDGSGYPKGLKGEEIPFCARIVGLVDVYDALRDKRPYKEPWSHEKTYHYVVNQSGKHFDPVVVEAFIKNKDIFEEMYKDLAIKI